LIDNIEKLLFSMMICLTS